MPPAVVTAVRVRRPRVLSAPPAASAVATRRLPAVIVGRLAPPPPNPAHRGTVLARPRPAVAAVATRPVPRVVLGRARATPATGRGVVLPRPRQGVRRPPAVIAPAARRAPPAVGRGRVLSLPPRSAVVPLARPVPRVLVAWLKPPRAPWAKPAVGRPLAAGGTPPDTTVPTHRGTWATTTRAGSWSVDVRTGTWTYPE